MSLNASKTTFATNAILLAFLLLAPTTKAEEKILCQNPPGPPGEIICSSGQLAACKVDGKSVNGFCFNRGNRTNGELTYWFLSMILKEEFSVQEFKSGGYDKVLKTGYLELSNQVFVTFTPLSR